MGKTLSQKIWDNHLVHSGSGEPDLLYIDLHLVHEVTSPQAFDGLRITNRKVRRPDLTVSTEDHNVPTENVDQPIEDEISLKQIETLRSNAKEFGFTHFPMGHPNQGIVHVIGPELGLTQPGMTVVCGDSHTSTHGAFGALAFGIGTSEVEHVLATQTLPQPLQETMAITITGELPEESSAKDVVLAVLGAVGTGGGIGAIAEFRGPVIEALSMEGRMTVCNMSIEFGAKAGLIAPDEITYEYLKGRTNSPTGDLWENALIEWQKLHSDDDAVFDREIFLNGDDIVPQVTWGTNPGQVIPVRGTIPNPTRFEDIADREAAERARRGRRRAARERAHPQDGPPLLAAGRERRPESRPHVRVRPPRRGRASLHAHDGHCDAGLDVAADGQGRAGCAGRGQRRQGVLRSQARHGALLHGPVPARCRRVAPQARGRQRQHDGARRRGVRHRCLIVLR